MASRKGNGEATDVGCRGNSYLISWAWNRCLQRMVLKGVPLIREGLAETAQSSLLLGQSFLSRTWGKGRGI